VIDIENELREALHAAVDDARCPLDVMDALRRRQSRRKVRAGVAAGLTVSAVAATAAIAGGLSGSGRPAKPTTSASIGTSASSLPATRRATPPASPPPPGWVRHPDGTGDYIDTPAAWHVGGNLVPGLIWVVSTGPAPGGGSCAPTAALSKLPANGALFAVIEYAGGTQASIEPYTFPPRVGTLGLGPVGGPTECWGVKTNLVLFQDGGRYFQVQTVFGSKASAALRAEVRRSLNTLHVTPLPVAERPPALCHAGWWTYCPQATWAYQVIGAAHLLELGNVGTRAISSLVGNNSFSLWTTSGTSGPPGSQCRDVSGTTVCQIGRRLWWRVHGMIVWVAPVASPYSTPPVRPGLPTLRGLRRLVAASRSTPLRAA
jgi:hypothetical protein